MKDLTEGMFDSWRDREPWAVQDPDFMREWLVPEPLRYYVYHNSDKGWTVIDRWSDFAVVDYKFTREAAIKSFYAGFNRPIPVGTIIKEIKNVNHET